MILSSIFIFAADHATVGSEMMEEMRLKSVFLRSALSLLVCASSAWAQNQPAPSGLPDAPAADAAAGGGQNNLTAAAKVIEDAVSSGLRPVDILIGMVAPMLYQIGEDWKNGILSVEQEHRFTAFCEQMVDMVSTKVQLVARPNSTKAGAIQLMNAPANLHTLGLRIISLWLASKGEEAIILDTQSDPAYLLELIRKTRTRLLLISIALPEQYHSVREIVEEVARLGNPTRPRVVLGGAAVKLGLIPPICGAELIGDISLLS